LKLQVSLDIKTCKFKHYNILRVILQQKTAMYCHDDHRNICLSEESVFGVIDSGHLPIFFHLDLMDQLGFMDFSNFVDKFAD